MSLDNSVWQEGRTKQVKRPELGDGDIDHFQLKRFLCSMSNSMDHFTRHSHSLLLVSSLLLDGPANRALCNSAPRTYTVWNGTPTAPVARRRSSKTKAVSVSLTHVAVSLKKASGRCPSQEPHPAGFGWRWWLVFNNSALGFTSLS